MDQVTVPRELLRQVIDSLEATCGHRCNAEYNPCHEQELVWQLRTALEQPAVEPMAFGRWHEDGYIDMVFLDEKECREYLNDNENPVALIPAPQAQQPPRISPGMSVEQTLEQWEHDFNNPMTTEQQADWVNREREFASAQAQQSAKAVKLTKEQLLDIFAGEKPSLRDVTLCRAVEQAVWEKLGVTE